MTLCESLTSLFSKAGEGSLEGIAGLQDVLWSVAGSPRTSVGACCHSGNSSTPVFSVSQFKAGHGDSHL